ncbi:MAG: glycosyltransferase [Clostridiales bacterium]|nr:glycosyltransferase [Clostridiales bacterium]
MPFISLIIPVYNGEKYLRRCLDSVAGQTFRDMEIIVVDDGSSDGSLAICREYEAADARFHVIAKENSGASDSRNRAIAQASGEYLQFMDCDDWLSEDASEIFAGAAKRYDSDLVIADFYRVEKDVYTEK